MAERGLRPDRRPGLRRPGVPRQRRDPHPQRRPPPCRRGALHGLPRRHHLRADPLRPAGPATTATAPASGTPSAAARCCGRMSGRWRTRCAEAGYRTGPLRQVAPGRQPAVPPPRARVRAVDLPRRRRRRKHRRPVGERLLRRHLLRERRSGALRRLLHRRVLPRGAALHRGAPRGAVLLLHRHQRPAHPAQRGAPLRGAVPGRRSARGAGAVLRHDHQHRREFRRADAQLWRSSDWPTTPSWSS